MNGGDVKKRKGILEHKIRGDYQGESKQNGGWVVLLKMAVMK